MHILMIETDNNFSNIKQKGSFNMPMNFDFAAMANQETSSQVARDWAQWAITVPDTMRSIGEQVQAHFNNFLQMVAFTPESLMNMTTILPVAFDAAFLPENISGTLLMLGLSVGGVVLSKKVVTKIMSKLREVWQVIAALVGTAGASGLLMDGAAYTAMASGLMQNVDLGLATSDLGALSVIIGIIVSYVQAKKGLKLPLTKKK